MPDSTERCQQLLPADSPRKEPLEIFKNLRQLLSAFCVDLFSEETEAL